MADYIDRTELLRQIDLVGMNKLDVYKTVVNMPRADAKKVNHAHWVLVPEHDDDILAWLVKAECSRCGEEHYGSYHVVGDEIVAKYHPDSATLETAKSIALSEAKSLKLDNYCHCCGARMDEEVTVNE